MSSLPLDALALPDNTRLAIEGDTRQHQDGNASIGGSRLRTDADLEHRRMSSAREFSWWSHLSSAWARGVSKLPSWRPSSCSILQVSKFRSLSQRDTNSSWRSPASPLIGHFAVSQGAIKNVFRMLNLTNFHVDFRGLRLFNELAHCS